MHLEIDGQPATTDLPQLREISPKFSIDFAPNSPFNASTAGTDIDLTGGYSSSHAFADGYYAMLKPLGAAENTTSASFDLGKDTTTGNGIKFAINVMDHITAVP